MEGNPNPCIGPWPERKQQKKKTKPAGPPVFGVEKKNKPGYKRRAKPKDDKHPGGKRKKTTHIKAVGQTNDQRREPDNNLERTKRGHEEGAVL